MQVRGCSIICSDLSVLHQPNFVLLLSCLGRTSGRTSIVCRERVECTLAVLTTSPPCCLAGCRRSVRASLPTRRVLRWSRKTCFSWLQPVGPHHQSKVAQRAEAGCCPRECGRQSCRHPPSRGLLSACHNSICQFLTIPGYGSFTQVPTTECFIAVRPLPAPT
jgi:hypothetical protein